jgi:hypothetical protein
MVRSALCTGHLYPLITHLCHRLSRPQGHSAAGSIVSMKNSNDSIGNRTGDLPVCSAVPQSNAPPRTVFHLNRSLYDLTHRWSLPVTNQRRVWAVAEFTRLSVLTASNQRYWLDKITNLYYEKCWEKKTIALASSTCESIRGDTR